MPPRSEVMGSELIPDATHNVMRSGWKVPRNQTPMRRHR